jgi:hypothetical protein
MMDIKIEQFIFIAIVLTLSDSFIVKEDKIASTEYARNCDWHLFLILITNHININKKVKKVNSKVAIIETKINLFERLT